MFADIDKLPPAHTLEMDAAGQLNIACYWDLMVSAQEENRPREYYVKTYREMLESCVSSHLMSDVPLGVFLSGGLDSSVVAALATKIRRESMETFAVGYGEQSFSELPYARQVAQHIGSRHHEVQLSRQEFFAELPHLIWHEDEPIVWPSSVALYFVASLAREQVKVVLTGEGSDETLGGYTRYAWTLANSHMDTLYRSFMPAFFRKWIRDGIGSGVLPSGMRRKLEHTFMGRDGASWPSFYFDNFYTAFSSAEQDKLLTPKARELSGKAYVSSMAYWNRSSGDLLHRLLYTDIHTYMVELLMKQDQMSMAASVESRVPFLDHVLVEFTARIPARYSIQGLSGKQILKLAVQDLLPRSIVYRQKMGFPTPWAYWLAGPQLDDLESMLLEPRTLERSLIERNAVRKLFAEHRAGQRDNGDRIWRLLNLETWQRVFRDGEVPTRKSVAPHAIVAVTDPQPSKN
jgi:asparagine synthase (glutamine-hydrolysing)